VDADVVCGLSERMRRTASEKDFEILAYCFMPDHMHILVEGLSSDSHLVPFCMVLRQRLAHFYAGRTGRPLWQPGDWERVLRDEDTTEACALYIFGNPIRQGLATSIRAHRFSGGTWFERL
jgi:putative transposase